MKGEVQLEPTGGRSPHPSDSDPLLEEHRHNHVEPSTSSSNQIKNDDIEAAALQCCRICLECDVEDDDQLISPCMCKGTQQFVHRSCLDNWRAVKEGFAFSHCTTCKAQFHLIVKDSENTSWRKIKFKLFVARDIFLVFLAVQTVITVLAILAYLLDIDGTFRNSFNDSWDLILSKHPIPFYYCVGVVSLFMMLGFLGVLLHCSSFNRNMSGYGVSMEACFALVIFFGLIIIILGFAYGLVAVSMAIQRIWQRHYHILTKTKLTQEYVVEDLCGCYSPPKMEPEHEERLKMLKLL